jgi:hypothetical protein
MPDPLLGALVAFGIAMLTTPVGVSGAVFLVPVQVSVLKVPSPALTPTNLLYNLVAIPGALARFQRERRLTAPLTRLLILGSLPGVVIGAVIRIELISGPHAFYFVIAAVLSPLGAWLALFGPLQRAPGSQAPATGWITPVALVVGVVGGIYGIGGGSILAPILVGAGLSVVEVAPATLAATFITSVAGVITYGVLSISGSGDIAPDWPLGLSLGVGGLAGSYVGVRLQSRLPDPLLRRALGLVALGLGIRYLLLGLA